MRVLILGAGVTGLAAAYVLAREGHAVTVLDAEPEVARGASHANGGQLSYSYVAPLAGPGVIGKVPGWLLDPDGPLRFRPRMDPGQWAWLLGFLRACNAATSERTTRRLLRLAYLSRDLTRELAARREFAFDFAPAGKLVLLPDAAAVEGARRQVALQAEWGSEQRVLGRDDCLALEPALAGIAHRIAGGVHTASEDAGDCRLFCEGIAAVLASSNHAVDFRLGTRVHQIIRAEGRVRGVRTGAGVIEADAVVVALGTGARALLRPLGLRLPVAPLKGYSLTLPITREEAAPRISVTDSAAKVVYARLGGRLRVAGMADLVGEDRGFDERRLSTLLRQAREAFPEAADWTELNPWTGLRPVTPTGLPLLGRVPGTEGLFLNLGQGGLGFTLAMGSAAVVAAAIEGRPAPIPLDGLGL
ncbi:D-amino acid dehydrogenase [Roseococcus sp. SYP-B2431]|uniref:D-amino acid dehydrogenase n=1 Tax=Roseococcus sp. SYP-B2431 TaxID=2496640 RepID=UPI00103CEEE1|nr:D-amino acid dehydrogenase [Roseococcus sp. SYP-B2431]TCH96689.1 D-amino acid dehydrogenase [Roseococcus sp. SYP-B2431]